MKKLITHSALLLVLFLAGLLTLSVYVEQKWRRPKDQVFIQEFSEHRKGLESLREMISKEPHVRTVAKWGIENDQSPISHIPPDGGMGTDRYQNYISILHRIGAISVYQKNKDYIGVSMWATGWGGNTNHVDFVWTTQQPSTLVPTIDELNQSSMKAAYRHIEGNWYIWADN